MECTQVAGKMGNQAFSLILHKVPNQYDSIFLLNTLTFRKVTHNIQEPEYQAPKHQAVQLTNCKNNLVKLSY